LCNEEMKMTRQYLLDLLAKLEDAIAFGVQSKGNLTWAKAQLAMVQAKLNERS
jgi:hypothetical protein